MRLDRLARRPPTWAFVLGVLALTAAVWAALQSSIPYLGHDEAVYATEARSWLTGAPSAQWGDHRAPGLPALGYAALAVHESVASVRAVGLLLALLAFGLFCWVGIGLLGPARGVVVALLVLSGPGFVRRVPEFLTDVGTAGLLAGAAYCLVRAQEGNTVLVRRTGSQRAGGRDRWLPAAAGFALGAFYLRYGALAGALSLALAAAVVWGPRAWLARWRGLLGAAAVLAVGLAPHLVTAERRTGSPFGMVRASADAGHPEGLGGLLFYLRMFPVKLAGPWGGVVMAAGLVAGALAAWRLARRRPRPEDRRTVFVVLAAVTLVVSIGLAAHGEPRFVFLSVFLLTLAGVAVLAELAHRWSRARTRLLLGALAAGAVATMPVTGVLVARGPLRDVTSERESLVAAAAALAAESGGAVGDSAGVAGPAGRCVVVTGYQPEVGWYSGCATASLGQVRSGDLPPNTPVSYLVFARGRDQLPPVRVRRLAADRSVRVVDLPAVGSLGAGRLITVGSTPSRKPARG
ncbi:glycosyltransferase [Actinopolymorpha rutila]|uniref:4-amino-4-deoxy-L-arabinose transferase-like glycosyltransferase n=1 Tax=Actinopolymorpha rutila TaxID=446787 RepID=A0A852Z745_9ACTN|nr:glycosyltransferase [Actinopolymorpha rutila]NYH87428.1 4-amino-4-deoxy-L-arabinose transferase-like glycosyltransferase [Actinopolymorpha rutila]